MADELKKPSNIAENVLSRTADTTAGAAHIGIDALKDAISRAADLSSHAADDMAETGKTAVDQADAVVASTEAQMTHMREATMTVADAALDQVSDLAQSGSDAVSTVTAAGQGTTAALSDVSKAWGEIYTGQVADYADLSQKALQVRTPQDLFEFQSFAAERVREQLSRVRHAYGRAFAAWSGLWQPALSETESLAA